MIAIIRVRGSIGVRKKILHTLKMLNLSRVNHLTLFPERKEIIGMAKKAESYITFGKIKQEVLEELLEKRGRLEGDKKITGEYFKKSKFKSLKELAKALIDGKESLEGAKIKRVFRLHPPKKGFERKGIKKPFLIGGALGYRGEEINELILKMI